MEKAGDDTYAAWNCSTHTHTHTLKADGNVDTDPLLDPQFHIK